MSRIILPQTIKRVLPATSNEAINLVKDSALVAVIGLGDLLRAAKVAVTRDFSIIPFIIAAVFYLIISSVIVNVFRRLENKYSVYE
jgi:polar amino acid transport system permease protein